MCGNRATDARTKPGSPQRLTGQPHARNLDRWRQLVNPGDLPNLHRVLTGLDRDSIEGVAGELSPFEELHGFSIDGVDLETAVLPDGWRDRLVKVQNANTAAPSGAPCFTGWRLDKEDLCVAKLIASRLRTIPLEHVSIAERALPWLDSTR